MKKFVLVLAVMAASCSIAAANELKQDKVLTTAATQMTDAEMDTVTAGTVGVLQQVCANGHCHLVGGGGESWHRNVSNGWLHSNGRGAHFTPAF
jgi:hypothetical protein